MTQDIFVSYAQNFEDVMLWRALKGVHAGFYIDLGASEPSDDSVTRAFYDRGWHGINVEPADAPFARLAAARPRDVNLKVFVGAQQGEQRFFLVGEGVGLSTASPEFAEQHRAAGWAISDTTVPVTTLAAICAEHVSGPIHFLKVDVEGAERAAFEGADFTRYRPWIILVEATLPNSQTPSHGEWEDLLTAAGYRFVYFDGLNRFYVAAEQHDALAEFFLAPPNVFDVFARHREIEARDGAEAARRAHDSAIQARDAAEAARATSESAQAEAERDRDAALARITRWQAWRAQPLWRRMFARAPE